MWTYPLLHHSKRWRQGNGRHRLIWQVQPIAPGVLTVLAAGFSPCPCVEVILLQLHHESRLVSSMQDKQMAITVWQPDASVQHPNLDTFPAGQPGPAGSSAGASATGELPCLALYNCTACCTRAESSHTQQYCSVHTALSAALGLQADSCSPVPSAIACFIDCLRSAPPLRAGAAKPQSQGPSHHRSPAPRQGTGH